jgi:hypothetical protein
MTSVSFTPTISPVMTLSLARFDSRVGGQWIG